jgi:hypothetical protein
MRVEDMFSRNFETDLAYSRQFKTQMLAEILLPRIPGATHVTIASTSDDFAGTDYWVHRLDSDAYSVDLKTRSKDWGDLTLEIWSKIPTETTRGRIGWTRDATKDTDFILWFWENTGRILIQPFAPLWSVFNTHWEEWLSLSEVAGSGIKSNVSRTNTNNGSRWGSQCLYVSEEIVCPLIDKWARGYVR